MAPKHTVAALEAQVAQLTRANHELAAQLKGYTQAITMQGYLLKHRPVTQFMGLFAQEWELRYFVLTGTVLRYYRSERDVAYAPRGVVDIQSCTIEPEDQGGQRQWRWRVVEPGGNLLLRLGTDNRAAGERWLSSLQSLGLKVVVRSSSGGPAGRGGTDSDRDRGRGRGRGTHPADTNTTQEAGRGLAAEADAHTQDRWEASSTDSELPDSVGKSRPQRATPLPQLLLHQQHHQQQQHEQDLQRQASTAAAAAMAAGVAAATTCTGPQAITSGSQQHPSSSGITPQAAAPPATALLQRQRSSKAPPAHKGDSLVMPPAGVVSSSRPPMSGSTPVHTTVRYSYLSSDGIWLAKHDGLLNLCIIILIVTNFRLILENLLKYGWRLNFLSYVNRSLAGRGNLPLVLSFPALVALSLLALAAERLGLICIRAEHKYKEAVAKRVDSDKQGAKLLATRMRQTDALMVLLHTFCAGAAFLLPCIVIHITQAEAVPGIFLMLWTLTVVMKLISYAHCHADLRAAHRCNELRPGERGATGTSADWAVLRYPENLTVSNMLYYLAVPTLTYQVNFPRSPRIRRRWLMRRVVELACFAGLLLFIANQYLEPAVSNAMKPLSESDWVRVMERVLKLALPNLYAWLCMFYCLFHLYLNILGELTRFGDREFYKAFWNASTVGEYWKLWNMPVHKWLLRTIYFPAMQRGMNRYWALVLVFFVSAIGHEVVVGVPLHMLRGWAFLGIMLQVPLISITESIRQRLKSDTWGNYVFWLTFCIIGQPVSLLMYVHDYIFLKGGYRHLTGTPPLVGAAAGAGSAAQDYLREA